MLDLMQPKQLNNYKDNRTHKYMEEGKVMRRNEKGWSPELQTQIGSPRTEFRSDLWKHPEGGILR